MNGNFVQRGEPALFHKAKRAEIAINNGADLVIELPLKYGISSANMFAQGCVKTALATGINGTFSFGATSPMEMLRDTAELISLEQTNLQVNEISKNCGISYPTALSSWINDNRPDLGNVLDDANNILGMEYIRNIKEFNNLCDYFTVYRPKEVCHDGEKTLNEFASGKYIRDKIISNRLNTLKNFLPDNCVDSIMEEIHTGHITDNKRLYETAVFSRIISMQANDFTDINGVTQGLENRIFSALHSENTLDGLYNSVKTKRFTLSRIRQIILASALGVTRADLSAGVSYIRILGFNSKGRELLKEMRKTASVPIVTNISDINSYCSVIAQRDRDLDLLAGKIYELCMTQPYKFNSEFRLKPFIGE